MCLLSTRVVLISKYSNSVSHVILYMMCLPYYIKYIISVYGIIVY